MSSIRVLPDLAVCLNGARVVVLTPSQGLRLAEQLIRKSTRKMMIEEAVKPPPVVRRSSARGRVVQ
jgi:hypothetical protein